MPKIKIKTKIKLDRKAARKFEKALAEAGLTPEGFLEIVVREGIEVLAGSAKSVDTEVRTKLGFEKDKEKDEGPVGGAGPEVESLEEAVKDEGETPAEPAKVEAPVKAPKPQAKKVVASKPHVSRSGRTRKTRRAQKA